MSYKGKENAVMNYTIMNIVLTICKIIRKYIYIFYLQRIHHEKLKHISDSYYANPKQAAKDGISPLFEQENYRSPLAFTWL